MNLRAKISLLAVLCAAFPLLSCGGGNLGGGVGEFASVLVKASADISKNPFEVNVLTGNTCAGDVSTGGTFVTDSADVTLTSTPFTGLTGQASPIFIDSYTVTFTPADPTSPALPPLDVSTIGTSIAAGGSLTMPVAIAPFTLKSSLVIDKGLQPCSLTTFKYFATITFKARELNTGKSANIVTSLTVVFADLVG
jgi:hypothetical protein